MPTDSDTGYQSKEDLKGGRAYLDAGSQPTSKGLLAMLPMPEDDRSYFLSQKRAIGLV
jgi:hypothetical protein